MPLWRNKGGLATLAPGKTARWESSYEGRDVGVAVAAPNPREPSSGIELVALGQGVFVRSRGEADHLVYTVEMGTIGSHDMSYDPNTGDWG